MVQDNNPRSLWDVLAGASVENQSATKRLVEHASGLLGRVVETFPNYTLHDQRHAENVCELMEKLLGPALNRLSQLEAALLILAAYFHDVGMVYSREELERIPSEGSFDEFLQRNSDAFLAFTDNGGEITSDIQEEYCRWRHADRVRDVLESVPDELLRWNGYSLREPLIAVCRSHNMDTAALRAPNYDAISLNDHCDLRFCAVLLRLADILDFDDSRSPRSVYDHLGLASRKTRSAEISDNEWSKHLACSGFQFPEPRQPNYILGFSARPTDPGTEHHIREFLDTIEGELQACRVLLAFCPNWRDLILPAGVDRKNIHGEGYVYGEFRFSLDRTSVLELFAGERLYGDRNTFVRELMQNALDATRLRVELAGSQVDPASLKIEVTTWEDENGYVWVRFDDAGIGMSEETVRDYFLNVGQSYYTSPKFRAEMVRAGKPSPFMPISRFGIGVLSCFLAGDKAEMSTLRISEPGNTPKPVRLTIAKNEEYFVLQRGDMTPTPMPSRSGSEAGYRTTPGTSIAIRINPALVEISITELPARLDSYLMAPPVGVLVNGRPASTVTRELLNSPWLSEPVQWSMSDMLNEVDDMGFAYFGPVRIAAFPLDLTRFSPSALIKGQCVAVVADAGKDEQGQYPKDLLVGWPENILRSIDPRVKAALSGCVRKYEFSINVGSVYYDDIIVHRTVDGRALDGALDALRTLVKPHERRKYAKIWKGAEDSGLVDWFARLNSGEIDWKCYFYIILGAIRRPGLLHDDEDDFSSEDEVERISSSLSGIDSEVVARFNDWGGISVAGHNGIALPGERINVQDPSSVRWSFFGAVSFHDRLRPELDIARERILGYPFNLKSATHLAVRRALDGSMVDFPEELVVRLCNVSLLRPDMKLTLGDILDADPSYLPEWTTERIIPVGDKYMSIAELRDCFSADNPHRITISDSGHFYGWLTLTLLQTELEIEVDTFPDFPYGPYTCVVRSPARPSLPRGLRRFPPLFFAPYAGSPDLLKWWGLPINANNPLAVWLIGNADFLANEIPAAFSGICRALGRNEVDPRDEINVILDRISRTRKDIQVPESVYLSGTVSSTEWWSK